MEKILLSKPKTQQRINRSTTDGIKASASRTISERFMSYITEGIIHRKFSPGTRISERAIARDLGISQVLAREYMERLIHHGWVERIHGRGISVREFNREEIKEIFEYREIIETGAMYHLASSISDSQLAELRSRVETMESLAASSDLEKGNLVKTADIEFHKLIVHFMGNRRVETNFKPVILQLSYLFYSRGSTEVLHDIYCRNMANPLPRIEHHILLEALEARDPSLAEQRMRDHIRYALSLAMKLYDLFQMA